MFILLIYITKIQFWKSKNESFAVFAFWMTAKKENHSFQME